MTTYLDELTRAMEMIADSHPRAVFLGQAVAEKGTGMTASFADLDPAQLIELPVFEDCQMGMAIGMALAGDLPVCVYPRWNFLLLAANQLVNHLDKLPLYSGFFPKVIIRTSAPTDQPMNPGVQHLDDFTDAFRLMLKNVHVERIESAARVVPAYREALDRRGSSLLVEVAAMYGDPL